MNEAIQQDLNETIVDFRSFESSSAFHIEGRGIISIKTISLKVKKQTFITLIGDIIITTPQKKWQRIHSLTFQESNIFPGNREDFLFTTDRFDFENPEPQKISPYISPHIVHIQKDTGLGEDDLRKLNALKYKNILDENDRVFLDYINKIKGEHHLRSLEQIQTFMNSTGDRGGDIDLF